MATLKSTEITGLTKNYRNFRLFGYTVCGEKFQGYNIFWFGTFLDMVCGITAPYWYEQKINIMQVLDLILSKTKKSHIFPICFIFSWKISRWKYFCGLETRYLWFMEWKLHTGINKKWFTCKFRFFFHQKLWKNP